MEQAQATILARVVYLLLHIFILSTVYRCSADGQGSWHSHLAYFAGFSASVLLSIALYVALTLMNPGYIPVVKGHKIQEGKPGKPKARHTETERDDSLIKSSSQISSASRTAPCFDLEGLLQGTAQLPDTPGLAHDPVFLQIEPTHIMADSTAAASRGALSKAERNEHGESTLLGHLSSLKEGSGSWTNQEALKADIVLHAGSGMASPSLAPKHEQRTLHSLRQHGSLGGDWESKNKSAHHSGRAAQMLQDLCSEDCGASQLIGAVHAPGQHGDCYGDTGSESASHRFTFLSSNGMDLAENAWSCAWWEKPGCPGRTCEWCGAYQRLRAHHCAVCESCVDTHDHHCAWLGTCIGARNQAMYLCYLAVQAITCAWAVHATLPCLTNQHPLLPWHTLFGVDWRVATTLSLLGLLLPYLAYLLGQQLYLAATAQTAREYFRRKQVPYLMHVNERVHPFSRGSAANLWDYFAWRQKRHWELPSTEQLIQRQMRAGRGCRLC